jgi:hypothetical protein
LPKALPLAVCALEGCQHLLILQPSVIDGLRRREFRRATRRARRLPGELLYLLLFFVSGGLLLRLSHAYDAVAARVTARRWRDP